MIRRFKVWNKWRKNSTNNWMHKLLVLLGLRHSPTFEVVMAMDHLGEAFINAGNTITYAANSLKTYLDAIGEKDGRDTESEATD